MLRLFFPSGAALWTRAGDSLLRFLRSIFRPDNLLNSGKHRKDARLGNVIEHIPAFAAVLDQAGIPQYHQLLRDVGLAVTEMSFHMANTILAIPQNLQNRQACRVGQHLEKLRLRFIRLCFNRKIINHIHNLEYDNSIAPPSQKGRLSPIAYDRRPFLFYPSIMSRRLLMPGTQNTPRHFSSLLMFFLFPFESVRLFLLFTL